jgi:hypothetical protein
VGVAYQAFLDSMAARASAKLSCIRSRMILGASLLDFWTQFSDVPGILDCRFAHTLGQFRLLGRNFLRRTAWLEISD